MLLDGNGTSATTVLFPKGECEPEGSFSTRCFIDRNSRYTKKMSSSGEERIEETETTSINPLMQFTNNATLLLRGCSAVFRGGTVGMGASTCLDERCRDNGFLPSAPSPTPQTSNLLELREAEAAVRVVLPVLRDVGASGREWAGAWARVSPRLVVFCFMHGVTDERGCHTSWGWFVLSARSHNNGHCEGSMKTAEVEHPAWRMNSGSGKMGMQL